MMAAGGNNRVQAAGRWLEVVSTFYEMFGQKIDKEIIQMVVQNSTDENVAFVHLQGMLDDFNATAVEAPLEAPSSRNPGVARDPAIGVKTDCIVVTDTYNSEINVDDIPHYTVNKPENLLEQLSLATVPPADLNLVMSSSLSLQRDPAIIEISSPPSSPSRPYSLFGDAPAAPASFVCPSISPKSLPSGKSDDSLFSKNPYLVSSSLFGQPLVVNNEQGRITESSNERTLSDLINDPSRRTMVLMRGLPGSGKSYKARQLCGCRGVIYSTDDYFLSNGTYHFEPRLLQNAHLWNQDRAKKAVQSVITPIFIDNTNMQLWEMKPYIVMAVRNDYKVEVIEPDTWWAWKPTQLVRTNTHGVPKSKIEIMKDRYESIKGNSIESILSSGTQPGRGNTIVPSDDIARISQDIRYKTRSIPKAYEEEQNRYRDAGNKVQRKQYNEDANIGTEVIVDIDPINPLHLMTSTPVANNTNTPVANSTIDSIDPHAMTTSTPTKQIDSTSRQKRLFSSQQRELNISCTEMERVNKGAIGGHDSATFQHEDVELLEDGNRNEGERIDFKMLSLDNDDNDKDEVVMAACLGTNRNPLNVEDAKNEKHRNNAADYIEPPQISRPSSDEIHMQQNVRYISSGRGASIHSENETGTNIDMGNISSGNIVDLVKSYQSCTEQSLMDKQTLQNAPVKIGDTNLIDLTDDGFGPTKYKNKQFDFNLQFISECFPDFKQSYCRDWLKRYNGDLVKTCDYLSRCSQVEELPDDPNVPGIEELLPKQKFPEGNISLDDIFENKNYTETKQDRSVQKHVSTNKVPQDILCNKDEEADCTIVLSPPVIEGKDDTVIEVKDTPPVIEGRDALPDKDIILLDCGNEPDNDGLKTLHYVGIQTQTDIEQVVIDMEDDDTSENLIPRGEMFFCENKSDSSKKRKVDNQNISIAIDPKLALELTKLFGKPTDDLSSDDFVVSLAMEVGKQIYDAWMGSIKARKSSIESRLKEDEIFAKQLQKEDLIGQRDQLKDLKEDELFAMQLQNEEHEGNISSPEEKKKTKKKDKKRIDTPFSSGQENRIFDGSFEPGNALKLGEETMPMAQGGKEKLTSKQMQLRRELYHMFPGVEENALDNILHYSVYNMKSAVAIVQNACGLKENPTVQHVYASDMFSSSNQIASPPRKKANTNTQDMPGPSNYGHQVVSPSRPVAPLHPANINIPNDELYQTMTEDKQTYQDFRAEAELHKNIRTEYFQKAAQAFQAKQGLQAQHYADKAQEHTSRMNEAHRRAAELTLKVKNRQYMNDQQVIDFHGLHTDEALRALSNFIGNSQKLGHKSVFVITGRGNHSKNKFSGVRNVVMTTLTKHNYKYKLHSNGGMFEVFLK